MKNPGRNETQAGEHNRTEKEREKEDEYPGPDICLDVTDERRSGKFVVLMTHWSSPRMVLEWVGLAPQLSKTQSPWAFRASWVGTELAPSLRQPLYQTTLQGGKGGWPSAQHLSSNICKRGSSPQRGVPHARVRTVTHWLFRDSLNITGKKKVCFFPSFWGEWLFGEEGFVFLCKNKSWPFH